MGVAAGEAVEVTEAAWRVQMEWCHMKLQNDSLLTEEVWLIK